MFRNSAKIVDADGLGTWAVAAGPTSTVLDRDNVVVVATVQLVPSGLRKAVNKLPVRLMRTQPLGRPAGPVPVALPPSQAAVAPPTARRSPASQKSRPPTAAG